MVKLKLCLLRLPPLQTSAPIQGPVQPGQMQTSAYLLLTVYYKLFDSEAVKWKRAQDRHRRKQVGLSPGVGPAQCLPVIPSLEALISSPQDLKLTAQDFIRISSSS